MEDANPFCANCGAALSAPDSVCRRCDNELAESRAALNNDEPQKPNTLNIEEQKRSKMWRMFDVSVSWVWALGFLLAYAWPYISSQPFPIAGLRKLSTERGLLLFLETGAVTSAAIWFSIPRWHSRDRLRIVQGGSIVLAIQGFLFAGMAFGFAFILFANLARSYANKLPAVVEGGEKGT